jgi:hypothetical protein
MAVAEFSGKPFSVSHVVMAHSDLEEREAAAGSRG